MSEAGKPRTSGRGAVTNIAEIIPSDLAEAADYISASWRDGILALIETGRRLIEVRQRYENQPGLWSRLIGNNQWTGKELLPFAKTHAYRLIAIAEDARLIPHVGLLPSDSYTLFQLTRLSDERFQQLIDAGRISPEMTRIDAADEFRKERRDEPLPDGCTVADLGALVRAGQKYSVIYADPPWKFKVYSGKGKQRSAERHYDTKSLDAIKGLPVESLAANDCTLLLWAVCPELPGALDVISAWGFEYKTVGFSWIKQNASGYGLKWGMGYWTRANMEMCLLATRGSPKRLAKDVHQVVMTPAGEHSRKPHEVQKRIERLLPGPYLELYGRRASPGWTVWGNQITRSLFHQHRGRIIFNASTLLQRALVAQAERRMISERTKAALQAARARGQKLGNPTGIPPRATAETRARGAATKAAMARAFAERLRSTIASLDGLSANAAARELERRGIATAQGGKWEARSVIAIRRRLEGSP